MLFKFSLAYCILFDRVDFPVIIQNRCRAEESIIQQVFIFIIAWLDQKRVWNWSIYSYQAQVYEDIICSMTQWFFIPYWSSCDPIIGVQKELFKLSFTHILAPLVWHYMSHVLFSSYDIYFIQKWWVIQKVTS